MIKDLTEGEPQSVLVRFTLPMFVSVVFQQIYNIADSAIAGKFAGEDALAAVGASYPITMIFMAIAVGSNVGCAVVISQLFGGKHYESMKTAVSTTLISSFVLSVILTICGLAGNRALMELIHTPENIFSDGALYLKIYIGGFLFLFLYNVATGIFTALGDSQTPLYFLIGSSVGNILLDLIFVAVFHWGVAGVAWATFIAQGIACVLALLTMKKRLSAIKTERKPALFSREMLGKISTVAIPSILQQSFVSVGNIFIQSLVNGFGSSVIAGYSAAIKLNTFAVTSLSTLGNGVSSFTAQNIGAGKRERMGKGLLAGIKMGIVVAALFFVMYFFGKGMALSLFMDEGSSKAAMETGRQFLTIVSPFYLVIALKLVVDGILRGAKAMKAFMVSTFADLLLRVVFAFAFVPHFGAKGIWMSWPVGWSVAMILAVTLYFTVLRGNRSQNFQK